MVQVRQIVVLLQGHCEGSATLKITYMVSNAKWKSQYDIRVLKDNLVELSFFAVISQSTSEQWKNVHLSLSTAKPSASKTAPPSLSAVVLQAQKQEFYYEDECCDSDLMNVNADSLL